MRGLIIGFLVAVFTFCAGYLAVRLVNSHADTIVDAFYPGPSVNATPTDFSEFSKLPAIPYCNLVRDTRNHFEQIVRVRGTYGYDMENSALGDYSCGENIWTWVEAEPDSNFMAATAKLKRGQRALAVFVGRISGPNYEGYGHLNGYRYRLVVMSVEELTPLPTSR
jgi:hypothetical protein